MSDAADPSAAQTAPTGDVKDAHDHVETLRRLTASVTEHRAEVAAISGRMTARVMATCAGVAPDPDAERADMRRLADVRAALSVLEAALPTAQERAEAAVAVLARVEVAEAAAAALQADEAGLRACREAGEIVGTLVQALHGIREHLLRRREAAARLDRVMRANGMAFGDLPQYSVKRLAPPAGFVTCDRHGQTFPQWQRTPEESVEVLAEHFDAEVAFLAKIDNAHDWPGLLKRWWFWQEAARKLSEAGAADSVVDDADRVLAQAAELTEAMRTANDDENERLVAQGSAA